MSWSLKFWKANVVLPDQPVTWYHGTAPVPDDVPSTQAATIISRIDSIASASLYALMRLNWYAVPQLRPL